MQATAIIFWNYDKCLFSGNSNSGFLLIAERVFQIFIINPDFPHSLRLSEVYVCVGFSLSIIVFDASCVPFLLPFIQRGMLPLRQRRLDGNFFWRRGFPGLEEMIIA
jgi:hypothetical protein